MTVRVLMIGILLALNFLTLPANAINLRPWCRQSFEDLSGENPSWKSLGGVEVQNLPLADLAETGVAHVPIPPSLLSRLNSDNVLLKHFLQASLQDVFQDDMVYGGSNLLVSAGTPSLRRGFNWHFDVNLQNRLDIGDIRDRRVRRFTVRVTVPVLSDREPPTVLRPVGGPWRDKAIQGTADQFTFFILNTIEHASPIRKQTSLQNREFLIFDFNVVSRPTKNSDVLVERINDGE